MSDTRTLRILKRTEVQAAIAIRDDKRSRSECTLLYELIQRNPERAAEFLRRLGYSLVKAA